MMNGYDNLIYLPGSINMLALLFNTHNREVLIRYREILAIISGITLRSVFVKAITGVQYSPLYYQRM